MDELEKARQTIDEVDREMAELFERRMKAVADVAAYKMERGLPIFVPERERAVLEKNAAYVKDPAVRSHYASFLQHTMNVSKNYQRQLTDGVRIAYSGVVGAFAYIAAEKIFPEGTLVTCPGFAEAYRAVENGQCEQAVLPIENSYAGEVGQVMDLMFSGPLFVNGVYTLKIRQNLLGVPGARVSDIRKVVSHPQALAQCREYILGHGFETEEAYNTAAAAREILKAGDISVAAIASEETADIYGLYVLERSINESAENATRFAVFSRVPVRERTGDPGRGGFMLMFTVRNEAGSLAGALDVIGRHGFNMTALRSRPMGSLAWQYYFFIEAAGDITSAEGQAMLAELREKCDMLKVCGVYPEPAEL